MNLNRVVQITRCKRNRDSSSRVSISFRKITTLFTCCVSSTDDNKVRSEECAYGRYEISEKESATETCNTNSERLMDVFNDHDHISDISKTSFEKKLSKNQCTASTKDFILREEIEKVDMSDIGSQINIEKCDEPKMANTFRSKVTCTSDKHAIAPDDLDEESLDKDNNQKHQGASSSKYVLREDDHNQSKTLNKSQNSSSTILKAFRSKEVYGHSCSKRYNLNEGYAEIPTFSRIFVDKVILQVSLFHVPISEHEVYNSSVMSHSGLNLNSASFQLPRTRKCIPQNRSKVQPSRKNKKQALPPVNLKFQLKFTIAEKLAIFPSIIIGKMIKECVSFGHFNRSNFKTIDVEICPQGRLVLQILNVVLKSYKLVDVVDCNRIETLGVFCDKESQIDCMSNATCHTRESVQKIILKRKSYCKKQNDETRSKSLQEAESCVKRCDTTHHEGSVTYPTNLEATQMKEDSTSNNKASNAIGINKLSATDDKLLYTGSVPALKTKTDFTGNREYKEMVYDLATMPKVLRNYENIRQSTSLIVNSPKTFDYQKNFNENIINIITKSDVVPFSMKVTATNKRKIDINSFSFPRGSSEPITKEGIRFGLKSEKTYFSDQNNNNTELSERIPIFSKSMENISPKQTEEYNVKGDFPLDKKFRLGLRRKFSLPTNLNFEYLTKKQKCFRSQPRNFENGFMRQWKENSRSFECFGKIRGFEKLKAFQDRNQQPIQDGRNIENFSRYYSKARSVSAPYIKLNTTYEMPSEIAAQSSSSVSLHPILEENNVMVPQTRSLDETNKNLVKDDKILSLNRKSKSLENFRKRNSLNLVSRIITVDLIDDRMIPIKSSSSRIRPKSCSPSHIKLNTTDTLLTQSTTSLSLHTINEDESDNFCLKAKKQTNNCMEKPSIDILNSNDQFEMDICCYNKKILL